VHHKESILRTVGDGWRIVRSTPSLRAMSDAMSVNNLVAAPFIPLIPAMVEQVLHAGRGANSALVTAQGVGAVIAGVAMGSIVSHYGLRRTMVGWMAALAPALVLYGAAPSLWWMVPALAVVGACYMGALSSFSTIGQTLSPPEARGRVMAINNASLGLLYPIGAIFQGWLGDHVGLRTVTVGSGVALAAIIVTTRLVRPGFSTPIEAAQRDVHTAVPNS
jgi:predicted MFS family arabinose efflux permease